MKNFKKLIGGAIVLVLAVLGYLNRGPGSEADPSGSPVMERNAPVAPGTSGRMVQGPDGPTDIGPTLERISKGERHPHRNDGSVFQNRERRLPNKPRGYYREYVHPTPGVQGPGPQRVVIGKGGDIHYTADHYRSFVEVKE